MSVWTCERIARAIGCTPQQIKKYCDFGQIPCFKTSDDNLQSTYSYRIAEEDMLNFFGCENMEEFKRVQYR